VTQKIQKIQKIIQKVIRKIRKIIKKVAQKSDTKNRKKSPLIFKFGCVLRIIDEIGVTLTKNEL
jgi:predicted ATP-dependent Lon-type protease